MTKSKWIALGRMTMAGLLAVLGLEFTIAAAMSEERPLTIARHMDINSLDPARSWSDTSALFNVSVYEQLLTLDKDNNLQPLLAKRWTVNPEQTEFRFELDPAARFSDGSPVESKDVKWSFERLKNMKDQGSFLADGIDSIRTPDASTVIFKLMKPNSEFAHQTVAGMLSIINSDVAAANGAIADLTAAARDTSEMWFFSNSAGSGPFTLKRYEAETELRLARNENYWRTKALVAEVIFRSVKDSASQADMLKSGAADIAMQIDPKAAASLDDTGMVIKKAPSDNFIYLALGPGARDASTKLTPEVRQAISLAIDRKTLMGKVLRSEGGRLLVAPIPLDYPGGAGHAEPEYNPDKAKQMLATAGLANGFTLLSVYPDLNVYGVDFTTMMKSIQEDLSKIGIKVDLKPVSFGKWREAVNGEHIPLTASYFAPDFYGTSQYVQFFGLSKGSNWAKRSGAERDPSILNSRAVELAAKALAAPTQADADKLWFEAGEEMIRSNVILPMFSPNILLAYRPGVKGVRSSACCVLTLSEISN